LAESSALEFDADAVWFLANDRNDGHARDPVEAPSRLVRLRIAKNRHGELRVLPFVFEPHRASFREDPE
jgi:replicative DNA helicase